MSIQSEILHVLPRNDTHEHVESVKCPCNPKVENDGRLIIHNAYDKREILEILDVPIIQ